MWKKHHGSLPYITVADEAFRKKPNIMRHYPKINAAVRLPRDIGRFIRTICTRRIWWSCEGLTSVTQQIHWIQLKHLLLRHMYNLSPKTMCYSTSWSYCSAGEPTDDCWLIALALYCAVPYIAACVDISRMVFQDRSICRSSISGWAGPEE